MCLIAASLLALAFVCCLSPQVILDASANNSISAIQQTPSSLPHRQVNQSSLEGAAVSTGSPGGQTSSGSGLKRAKPQATVTLSTTTFQNRPLKLKLGHLLGDANGTTVAPKADQSGYIVRTEPKRSQELRAVLRSVYKLDKRVQIATANITATATKRPSVSINGTWAPMKVASGQVETSAAANSTGETGGKSATAATTTTKAPFGEQASGSLFRPSFLKGLLNSPKGNDEEEEVTQTILVPAGATHQQAEQHVRQHLQQQEQEHRQREQMQEQQQQQQQQQAQQQQQQQAADIGGHLPAQTMPPSMYSAGGPLMAHQEQYHAATHNKRPEYQPKPEASLQLTSTEMNSILNDREAPEFYREREYNGDGVVVGEEQPRLGTAASSNGYSGHGGFMPASYEAGDAFGSQRLLQAGSEDGSMGGGFNHRFGSQSFGTSGDEYSGAVSARLMQSPAEFREMGVGGFGGASSGGFGTYGGSGTGGGYGSDSYSPNSGLLRGASGEFNADAGEAQSYDEASGFAGRAFGGGYGPGSPMLEKHASELYGGPGVPSGSFGEGAYAGSAGFQQGEFIPGGTGRLLSAGSHVPGSAGFAGSGMSRPIFEGSDEYSSRFGAQSMAASNAAGLPYSQRGFATQNSMMMRGNSMLSNSMHDMRLMRGASSHLGSDGMSAPPGGSGGNKLMPLSPVIPVAEDMSSSNYREVSSGDRSPLIVKDSYGAGSGLTVASVYGRQPGPQVHDALEDDPADSSDPSETEGANGSVGGGGAGLQQSSVQQYEAASMGGPGAEQQDAMGQGGDDGSSASIQEMQARAAKGEMVASGQQGQEPNLVLNVPPPNIDNSLQSSGNSHRPTVEYSRSGSAGYLAPSLSGGSSNGLDSSGASGGGTSGGSSSRPSFRLRQKILKKTSGFLRPHKPQYDPAENPAHTGKYIID